MSYWYLGSPYSLYPRGLDAAHRVVCEEAARLIKHGVPVFCPIAHTHPISLLGELDALDHELWLPLDKHMMVPATGLIVLKMISWERSRGLEHEIDHFTEARKPIVYMDPGFIPHELQEMYQHV